MYQENQFDQFEAATAKDFDNKIIISMKLTL